MDSEKYDHQLWNDPQAEPLPGNIAVFSPHTLCMQAVLEFSIHGSDFKLHHSREDPSPPQALPVLGEVESRSSL